MFRRTLVLVVCALFSCLILVSSFISFQGLTVGAKNSKQAQRFEAQVRFFKGNQEYVLTDTRFILNHLPAFLDPTRERVVIVTQKGVTWGDFFHALPWRESADLSEFGFVPEDEIQTQLHGKTVDGLFQKPIAPGDEVSFRIER